MVSADLTACWHTEQNVKGSLGTRGYTSKASAHPPPSHLESTSLLHTLGLQLRQQAMCCAGSGLMQRVTDVGLSCRAFDRNFVLMLQASCYPWAD